MIYLGILYLDFLNPHRKVLAGKIINFSPWIPSPDLTVGVRKKEINPWHCIWIERYSAQGFSGDIWGLEMRDWMLDLSNLPSPISNLQQ